jgi:hypothetical protein
MCSEKTFSRGAGRVETLNKEVTKRKSAATGKIAALVV